MNSKSQRGGSLRSKKSSFRIYRGLEKISTSIKNARAQVNKKLDEHERRSEFIEQLRRRRRRVLKDLKRIKRLRKLQMIKGKSERKWYKRRAFALKRKLRKLKYILKKKLRQRHRTEIALSSLKIKLVNIKKSRKRLKERLLKAFRLKRRLRRRWLRRLRKMREIRRSVREAQRQEKRKKRRRLFWRRRRRFKRKNKALEKIEESVKISSKKKKVKLKRRNIRRRRRKQSTSPKVDTDSINTYILKTQTKGGKGGMKRKQKLKNADKGAEERELEKSKEEESEKDSESSSTINVRKTQFVVVDDINAKFWDIPKQVQIQLDPEIERLKKERITVEVLAPPIKRAIDPIDFTRMTVRTLMGDAHLPDYPKFPKEIDGKNNGNVPNWSGETTTTTPDILAATEVPPTKHKRDQQLKVLVRGKKLSVPTDNPILMNPKPRGGWQKNKSTLQPTYTIRSRRSKRPSSPRQSMRPHRHFHHVSEADSYGKEGSNSNTSSDDASEDNKFWATRKIVKAMVPTIGTDPYDAQTKQKKSFKSFYPRRFSVWVDYLHAEADVRLTQALSKIKLKHKSTGSQYRGSDHHNMLLDMSDSSTTSFEYDNAEKGTTRCAKYMTTEKPAPKTQQKQKPPKKKVHNKARDTKLSLRPWTLPAKVYPTTSKLSAATKRKAGCNKKTPEPPVEPACMACGMTFCSSETPWCVWRIHEVPPRNLRKKAK